MLWFFIFKHFSFEPQNHSFLRPVKQEYFKLTEGNSLKMNLRRIHFFEQDYKTLDRLVV